MSAWVQIRCDCGDGGCTAHVYIPTQSANSARVSAHRIGWDCDVIGGETVDWAPGHQITTATRTQETR